MQYARGISCGFEVTLVCIGTENVEINLARLAPRVEAGGHNVPESELRHHYRNQADEEEKTWWDGLWEFYDRYSTDGISLVLGDPTDGKFVSITPLKKPYRTL